MIRLRVFLSVVLCLIVAAPLFSQEKRKKEAFLDSKEAGADFQIQGEYVGKLGGRSIGVQVISLGDGTYDSVTYSGGLPGAGFDGERKIPVKFQTMEGVVKASGDGFESVIANDKITVKFGGATEVLEKVKRESPTLAKAPPEGAVVLFDGTNVDQWEPGRLEAHGLMGVGTKTKKSFENFTLHLEFRTPYMPKERGQSRGNSGMYLGDQYECQVLDSFGLEGKEDECGGIYKNARPKVNMCLPPLSWQTYDVEFTCSKFDADGKVTAPARVTIKHNGVVIHDNLELKTTPGGGRSDEKPGPLFLQDHSDPVRYRNIWLVEKK